MSVRNVGTTIREARLKAGLSQEKLSEGICSALSLSRIENGSAGVSPGTFQALMSHAGAPCEVFPIFASRNDFDCFYTLKRVRFYIDSWQLKEAYNDLEKVEHWEFADNKFYYQEWVLCHCRLQFRSGKGNHPQIMHSALQALHVSRPHIDVMDFRNLLLSINEMELLIYYAQAALYTNEPEVCLSICTQLSAYLENRQLSFIDKEKLLSENAVVYAKYYISQKDYASALTMAKTYFDKLTLNTDDTTRHELVFLMGLADFYLGQQETAFVHFKAAFFSAHSIGSCYATTCLNYLVDELGLDWSKFLLDVPTIPLSSFQTKEMPDTVDYSDGSYDLFAPEVITIGGLIRDLREEQKISQQKLCHGLCSKSKLSKIENNTLQPSVVLAETLLQRLGIADVVFTFFGSDKEKILDDLQYKISYTPQKDTKLCQKYIEQMENLITDDDVLYYQYILFEKAQNTSDHKKRIELLLEALIITMPDFDFNISKKQCFSLNEFGILVSLGESYIKSNVSLKGLSLLFQLLEYITDCNKDILDSKRLLSYLLVKMIALLYSKKYYPELCDMQPHFSIAAIKGYIYELGNIYAHYSQALGESQRVSEIPLYSCYAYYNFLITQSAYTEHFKQTMLHDWKHSIL